MSYPEQHEKEIAKQVQLQKMKDHKKERYLKLTWAWFIKIEEQAEKKNHVKRIRNHALIHSEQLFLVVRST